MKYIDINAKFTAAVNSYLAQGYRFNTSTMGGSQGEIAAVDLTNGKEIIRVLLKEFNDFKDMTTEGGVELIVGRVTDDVHPDKLREYQTVWNDRLKVISSKKFYKLSGHADMEPFYGTEEEATAASEKRFNRYIARTSNSRPEDVTAKAALLVKEFVRREFGIKRVVMDNIRVIKRGNKYTVIYNKHTAQLY